MWYENYINNIRQTNEDFYREFTQEYVNSTFEDTTLLRTVEEEKYPFQNEYEEYEVHIDSVAEISTNIDKVVGDFISLTFKDCSHINYRGQKYIYDNETYLCYDKILPLSKVAVTKLIRCNNEITWINSDNGDIVNEKVFLGYEVSSTNDQVNKDGTISNRRLIIYVQGNENTKKIKVNQRFMFEHDQCFRVEEINNYNQESNTNGDVTLIKIILAFSSFLPNDNKELNICDYYNNQYSIKINQDSFEQVKDFTGTLDATVKLNDEPVDNIELTWVSDDSNIVDIDDNGEYIIKGNNGDSVNIKCYIKGNDDLYDVITISVTDTIISNKVIIIEPIITELKQGFSQDIICNIYENNSITTAKALCTPNWINDNYYTLSDIDNGYRIKNNKMTNDILSLTFSYENCDTITMDIKLKGLF